MRALILSMVVMLATVFVMVGCASTEADKNAQNTPNTEALADTQAEDTAQAEDNVLGEGNTSFLFTVVDGEKNEKQYEIHTDKETVGEALLELNLIAGDEGDYGLYVKTVDGIDADYDKDGVYWAFYVDDAYAQGGVDTTKAEDGHSYAFKIEK